MLFNPHSQIQEEPPTRNSHSSSLNSHYLTPHYNPSSNLNNSRHDDYSNKSLSQGSPCTSGVCSYDIYGNELSLEDDNFNSMLEQKEMDLECIQEEEAMSPDGVTTVNQENNDPVLHMITPLKKRQIDRPSERRRSFAINRSPLLDITPVSKRKCSHHLEPKIERSFLGHTTPRDDSKHGINDVLKLR